MGILTVAVVTKPFFFEGIQRMKIAEQSLEELRKCVDASIVIPNDRLLSTITRETTAIQAFAMCDDVLKQAVEGISDLITMPGIINTDFADIRAVMENAGSALMGIGTASGENRAVEAAKAAISSPLLELSIAGAKGVLFSIAGGDDLTMFEIQDAAKLITESIDPNAKVIFGTVHDDRLKKNELKITVIASGFSDVTNKKSLFQNIITNKEEERKSKLFGSFSVGASMEKEAKVETQGSLTPTEEKKQSKNDYDNENDWGAVPAFLRRQKK
jgi:cell division protein FtsZ